MKFFAVFLALLVGLIGLASAQICARDNNSNPPGNPQNFPDIGAMEDQNRAGGSKCFKIFTHMPSLKRKQANLISYSSLLPDYYFDHNGNC